jgi:hypothetical protein
MVLNHHLSQIIQETPVAEEGIIIEEYIDMIEEEEYLDVNATEEDLPQVYEEYKVDETSLKKAQKCNECNAEYSTAKSLLTHIENEHHPSNHLKCSECNNRFKCHKKLQTHLNKHEADQSFRNGFYYCRLCDKQCLTRARLIAHKQTHFMDFECDYCGKRFTKYEFMQKHVVQHVYGRPLKDPNDVRGKIVCPLCSKLVPKDRVKRHNFIFHSDERPYKCEYPDCGKTFK